MGNDMSGVLARLGANWGWIVAYGVLSVLAGIVAILYPHATLAVIAVIFAIQLIFASIYEFVFAWAIPNESGWLRAVVALLAVLSLVVAIYLLGHIGLTLLLLAVILGVYWIVQGVTELFVAIGHPEVRNRGWVIISGILSVVAGAIVVLYPGISLVFLTLVLGFWLIIFGISLIGRGFVLRSAVNRVATTAA